jgi:hypothetical protein
MGKQKAKSGGGETEKRKITPPFNREENCRSPKEKETARKRNPDRNTIVTRSRPEFFPR